MTCIIGLVEDSKAYIGGDSAIASGSTVRILKEAKAFRNGPFVMGGTGSPRMTQLLQYGLDVPVQDEKMSDEQYMITVFAEAVRKVLKEHGFAEVEDNKESFGTFLVGYHGGLYAVYSDLQVTQYQDGMEAIGSGSEFALGALYVLSNLNSEDRLPPEERIVLALAAAAYFDANVKQPFAVKRT